MDCEIDKYKKAWRSGEPETPCGSGSTMGRTEEQRIWIPSVIEKYNIRSIVDVGAGDLNWIKTIDFPYGMEYTPYDLVPRHDDVQQLDIITEVPQKADLAICFWVLNHFNSIDATLAAMDNIKKSGAKYFMTQSTKEWNEPHLQDLYQIEEIIITNPKYTVTGCLFNLHKS